MKFNLRGPSKCPNLGISEFTDVKVLVRSCKYHNGRLNKSNEKIHNFAIRIGAYLDNTTIIAAEEINHGTEPPEFGHSLRSIQRWFNLSIKELIAPFLRDERLPAVQKWVCVEELVEDYVQVPRSPKKVAKHVSATEIPPPPKKHTSVTPSPTTNQSEEADENDEVVFSDTDSFGGGLTVKLVMTGRLAAGMEISRYFPV